MKSRDFLTETIVDDAATMHQDHEVQMARKECYHAAEHAIAIHRLLRNLSESTGLEGWVSGKITLANDYLNTVREHLEYNLLQGNTDILSDKLDAIAIAEGKKCNHTAEGTECPVHGLAECGTMYRESSGARPDYLPFDNDGNEDESMNKALQDKKKVTKENHHHEVDQAQSIADKLTSGKNLAKLNAMAHDSTIYRALDRYFAKHNIPETIYNRVAAIVFKKLRDSGRRLTTEPTLQEQGVAEATAYDKRGITVSPNRTEFGDTADWQAAPFTSRDNRLKSRTNKTGSATRLPPSDSLAHSTNNLKLDIKHRTGNDEYGKIFGKDQTSQYAKKPHLPEEGAEGGSPRQHPKRLKNALGGLERAMTDLIQTDPKSRQQDQETVKQRIRSAPIAGPKGQLPESGVVEGSTDSKAVLINKLLKKDPELERSYLELATIAELKKMLNKYLKETSAGSVAGVVNPPGSNSGKTKSKIGSLFGGTYNQSVHETDFAGEKTTPPQRPGDQVRGKEKAIRKNGKTAFLHRLVGDE